MDGQLDVIDGRVYVNSGGRFRLLYRSDASLEQMRAEVAADRDSSPYTLDTFPENQHPVCFRPKDIRQYLPPVFSHRPLMTRVKDQASRGTCYAFGTLAQHEFNWLYQGFSEQFLIWAVKKRDNLDEGASTCQALVVLSEVGVCPESVWPYTDYTPFPIWGGPDPSNSAQTLASQYRCTSRLWLDNSTGDIKRAIAEKGYVVTVGVQVIDSCWPSSGVIRMPSKRNLEDTENIRRQASGLVVTDAVSGKDWHDICLTGFDDTSASFEFKNSWGEAWGNHGYGSIPYDYVVNYGDSPVAFRS